MRKLITSNSFDGSSSAILLSGIFPDIEISTTDNPDSLISSIIPYANKYLEIYVTDLSLSSNTIELISNSMQYNNSKFTVINKPDNSITTTEIVYECINDYCSSNNIYNICSSQVYSNYLSTFKAYIEKSKSGSSEFTEPQKLNKLFQQYGSLKFINHISRAIRLTEDLIIKNDIEKIIYKYN